MSILKQRKSETSPADIAQRIEALKVEIRALDQEQLRLAALSISDPKVEADYQKNISDSVEKQREVERLQAALIGLDLQEKRQAAAGRVEGRRERLEQFEAAVGQRQMAVEELARGLEVATTAFGKFLAAAAQMEILVPAGAALPWNAQLLEIIAGGPPLACGPAIAIAAEMFRAGGGAQFALPGARPPTLQVADLPSSIEPLSVTSAKQTEAIIASIRDQVERADAADKTQEAA